MWFLYSLSWLSTIIQLGFIVLSVAAGLYYVAELVEEYTVLTGKIIKILIFINIGLYTGLLIFEELPLTLLICGFISQALHLMLLRTFPFFIVTSLPFIGALIFVFVNHYLAFSYFSSVYYPFSEILAYFTLCLWIIPFTFFISLSANENVLPTFSESRPLISDDNDVVTNYFSRKGKKRYGLLTFFNFAKESILPQRLKKSF